MASLIGTRVVLLTRDLCENDEEDEVPLFPGAEGTIIDVNYIEAGGYYHNESAYEITINW